MTQYTHTYITYTLYIMCNTYDLQIQIQIHILSLTRYTIHILCWVVMLELDYYIYISRKQNDASNTNYHYCITNA